MKAKMWLVLSAVITVASVGLGTTLALFSASVQTQNTFTAGRLCLNSERNDGDRVPGPMFYVTPQQGATPSGLLGLYPTGLWAPGDTNTRTLTVDNLASCGGMDAWLDSVHATLHAGSYAPMADKLMVEIYTPLNGPDALVAQGTLSQFLAGEVLLRYPGGAKVPLYSSSNRHLKFKITFDLGADNSYQDKTLVVDFTVTGVQMANNP